MGVVNLGSMIFAECLVFHEVEVSLANNCSVNFVRDEPSVSLGEVAVCPSKPGNAAGQRTVVDVDDCPKTGFEDEHALTL